MTSALASLRTHVFPLAAGAPPYTLVVLNSTQPHLSLLDSLWTQAERVICADGGANRIFDSVPPDQRNKYVPDYIHGDRDSVRNDTAEFFAAHGTEFRKDASQDYGDVTKALRLALSLSTPDSRTEDPPGVVLSGAFDGRLDHTFNNINAAVKAVCTDTNPQKVALVGSHSLAYVLPPGLNTIAHCPQYESVLCGVFALASPGPTAELVSTGLKWNLDGLPMGYGAVQSSSNEVVDDVVTVDVPPGVIGLYTATLLRV